MNLPSITHSRASAQRSGGIALSSALLAVPALVAGHPGTGAILLAAALVAAAVFVERRAHAAPRSRELSSRALSLVPPPSRARSVHVAPQARWELVERDGQRSLSMRWR